MSYLLNEDRKILAAYGCSNSGTSYGTSWPEFLSGKLGYKLYRRSAPGANVGMHLEKLNYDLQNEKIDLVVLQLSSYERLTLGLAHFDNEEHLEYPSEDGNRFKNIGCYTYGCQTDDDNFRDFDIKSKDSKEIHQFMFYDIQASNWMKPFANQQLYTFISLCKQYNKKLFIFSWFQDVEDYILPEWRHMLDGVGFINKEAEGWFNENGIDCIPNDGHYDTNAHERLTNEFLFDPIYKYI